MEITAALVGKFFFYKFDMMDNPIIFLVIIFFTQRRKEKATNGACVFSSAELLLSSAALQKHCCSVFCQMTMISAYILLYLFFISHLSDERCLREVKKGWNKSF